MMMHRPAFQQHAQRRLNALLRETIDARRRLIEDKYFRIRDEGPRETEKLPLADDRFCPRCSRLVS